MAARGDELTPKQAATVLGVSESTVRRLEASGELEPSRRLPARGDRRYRRADVEALKRKMESRQPIVRESVARLSRQSWRSGRAIWDTDPGTAGRRREVDLLDVGKAPASERVADALGLTAGAETVVRRRRYLVDDRPVMIATSYLPADIVGGTAIEQDDTGPGGTFARLAELGQEPVRARERVTVREPEGDETELLELGRDARVLAITRVVWTAAGRAVEVNDMAADAASYELSYEFDL
jgi:GntR family transcriptional regulator